MSTLAPRVGHACGSPGQTFRQRGQVLILFVMGATVIFVIGAIVVDIGLWVTERRKAQAAADFAALAAATQLGNPNPFADAQVKGLEFARRNGYDDGDPKIEVRVIPNINGDPDQVQVEIEEHGGSLFAGIFGINSMNVGATAVGKYVPPQPGPGWALFANHPDCDRNDALDYPAQDTTVDGVTHSNATIRISGKDNTFNGPVNWVCPGGLDVQGTGNVYPNATQVGAQTAPINLTWADIPCTVTFSGDVAIESQPSLWASGDRLNDNVICARNLTLDHDNTQGNVTFAAQGNITITGQNNDLRPFPRLPAQPPGLDRLLAFSPASPSVARDAIEINAGGGTYRGYIHAPNSEAEITGYQNVLIAGSVVANTVRIAGDDLIFDSTGFKGPNPPPNIHLED
jgi:hypothetical protein